MTGAMQATPHDSLSRSILIIGFFLSQFSRGRAVCEDLAERLTANGWHVLTASGRGTRAGRVIDMLFSVWRHRAAYGAAQVDVYSGSAFLWAEAVCWLLRRLKKPYLLVLRGGNLPEYAAKHAGSVSRLLQSAVTVTAPSGYLVDELRAYRDDIQLLPNPIDIARYTFQQRTNPRPRLMWLRSFHRIYNPQLAPKVVGLLVDEFPEIHLTMVGPDKDGSLELVQQTAHALGIEGRMTLIGQVAKQDVPDTMNQGDIFINTTGIDNTPVSVMEAMACGLCVVSTQVGGIPYLVDDEVDGLLVPPEAPEAMAEAIRRILRDTTLASGLSANARAKTAEFDWGVILPKWETLLSNLTAGGDISPR